MSHSISLMTSLSTPSVSWMNTTIAKRVQVTWRDQMVGGVTKDRPAQETGRSDEALADNTHHVVRSDETPPFPSRRAVRSGSRRFISMRIPGVRSSRLNPGWTRLPHTTQLLSFHSFT